LRRGWIRLGLRLLKMATLYATASDGYPQRTSRMFSPLMSCLMSFPLPSPVGRAFDFPITDIAPEEARGDSLEDALVIYRHFCDILTSRYGKPKRRKNRNGFYDAFYVSPQGVGINPGGCRSFVECYIKSAEEMFIESEYARLVAKGYISEDE